MIRTHRLCAAGLVAFSLGLGTTPRAAEPPRAPEVSAAMRMAATYYCEQVAVHGGYVYFYSLDLTQRWGEGLATQHEVWVQPPGTPTVGMAYLAAFDATGEEYLNLHLTEDGSPAKLLAPTDPGTFEVRYVRGTDHRVLRRTTLAVTSPAVSLSVPATATAGTRFEVSWTGPARSGDYIAVAPAGSRPQRKLDWSYVTMGSPLTLAAPFSPGNFEVRYLGGDPPQILGWQKITVVD